MSSISDSLQRQFLPENCYEVFGAALRGLEIQDIKGTNCTITFDFPVTAISGYNGAGKSTIAQIALCMYRAIDNEETNKRKYLKDFFVKTLLDQSPYLPTAEIIATYAEPRSEAMQRQTTFLEAEPNSCSKKIRVFYSTDRWAGYKHQPKRTVFYYGMSYFIPYQEQNSNLLRDGKANVTQSVLFGEDTVRIVADILSIQYATLTSNAVSNQKRTERVFSANKHSASYSENHMGCGEGRLLKLVYALETAPKKSLFVIEEPETALHQLAQYKLAQYFLDVCNRKKHQIIFTTHSHEIQKPLPPQARKHIRRERDGYTSVIDSPSIAEVENYLSGGNIKRMILVTEDEIGKIYLEEILRAYCPKLLENCQIFAMELGHTEIKKYVKQSQQCGIKIFGVVDECRRADISNHTSAFPEESAPEISFFSDAVTKAKVEDEFHFLCDDLTGDHHQYFSLIARNTYEDVEYVKRRCIKLYVQSKNEEYYHILIQQLSIWLDMCGG